MKISKSFLIEIAIFTLLFLAFGGFIAGFYISKKSDQQLEINESLSLDFDSFEKIRNRINVKMNGKEYRAEILEDLTFEKAKEKCKNQSGSLSWNRVQNLPDKTSSFWMECGNETDLYNENIRDVCSEVSFIK